MTTDPFAPPSAAPSGTKEQLLTELLNATLAGSQSNGEPMPYYHKAGRVDWVGPRNRYTRMEMKGVTWNAPGRKTFSEHEQWFVDKWYSDAKFRTRLTALGVASGWVRPGSSSPEDYLKAWLTAGEYSSRWADQGNNKSPWEVLQFFAGVNGGADPTKKKTTTTSTSINIYEPEEARGLINTILSAALGRKATDQELEDYLAAVNAASRANPSKTVTTTDYQGNSTSTTTGGIDPQGIIEEKASDTTEGQAYQTNNVFDEAMRYLAGG